MEYKGIIENANKLKKSSLYKVVIAESTHDIIIHLNSAIGSAHKAGLSRIRERIPSNFRQIDKSVPNSEIQMAVYYNIIMEFESKGYDVSLDIRDDFTVIEVSWSIRASIKDLDEMRRKIASVCKK